MKSLTRRVRAALMLLTLIAGGALLVPAGAQNPGATERIEQKAQNPELRVVLSLLRVELDQDHRFGSGVTVEQMAGVVTSGGVNELGKRLGQSGATALVMQGESNGTVGQQIRFFLGREDPYLTTLSGNEEGSRTRTTSQQVISAGTTAHLVPKENPGGGYVVECKVDSDGSRIVQRDESRLVGRVRLSWSSTVHVAAGHGVQVGRFVQEVEGNPEEYVFVLEVFSGE